MKIITLFATVLLMNNVICQDYTTVHKISKKCSIVYNGDFYGLVYNKKVVQKMECSEYDFWDGLILFYTDSGSVCWNYSGEKILEFKDAKMSISESDDFIMVNGKNYESALYTDYGNEIIPFGHYTFDFFENGSLVHNDVGQQAFYSFTGREILPFDDQEISVIDDYEDVISVSKMGETLVLLNDRILAPNQFRKLNEFTFVQDHEITIEDYLYFLGNQQKDAYIIDPSTVDYMDVKAFFPDTTKIEAKFLPLYRSVLKDLSTEERYEEFETKVYLPSGTAKLFMSFKLDKEQKALAQFPVTGISQKQAAVYCEWLSLICSEYSDYDIYDSYPLFRLPTSEEWEALAKQGLREEFKDDCVPDSLSKENCMMFVYNSKVQCKNSASYMKASYGGGTVPSYTIPIDGQRRFQVFGNVAEMTSEYGVAKGGSYIHSAKEAQPDNDILYTEPEPWLGFRIVGEYHY